MDDLLLTAGGGDLIEGSSEYSPSVVKMNQDIMDESF